MELGGDRPWLLSPGGPEGEPHGLGLGTERREGSPWQCQASNEVTYVGGSHKALYTIQRTGSASFNECVLHALGLYTKHPPILQRIILKL